MRHDNQSAPYQGPLPEKALQVLARFYERAIALGLELELEAEQEDIRERATSGAGKQVLVAGAGVEDNIGGQTLSPQSSIQ